MSVAVHQVTTTMWTYLQYFSDARKRRNVIELDPAREEQTSKKSKRKENRKKVKEADEKYLIKFHRTAALHIHVE